MGAHHRAVSGLVAGVAFSGEEGAGKCLFSGELADFSSWVWGSSWGDGTAAAKWSRQR